MPNRPEPKIAATWRLMSFADLGKWIDLLTKRAMRQNRSNKAKEDLEEARFYFEAMGTKLEEIEENL